MDCLTRTDLVDAFMSVSNELLGAIVIPYIFALLVGIVIGISISSSLVKILYCQLLRSHWLRNSFLRLYARNKVESDA